MSGSALVIGASGQVGRHAAVALRARGWRVTGTFASAPMAGLRPLDLLDDHAIEGCVREERPSVVVLASALTNVDRCEAEPDLAARLNARAPGVVAAACLAEGGRVIHLSSDYVFDGRDGPYAEEDPPSPVSVYGRTKLEGERRVLAADPRNLTVRTTVVFSHDPAGRNFVMQVRARLSGRERMRVPSDQRSSPTYAPDLGEALAALCDDEVAARLARTSPAPQLLNVVGPELIDRHAFAVRAARALGLPCELIEPVETASLGQRARRPLRAGLADGRLRALGLGVRGIDAALADVASRAVGRERSC
jgi:dTDP-4-dehydrorhamnose reductase